MNAPGGGVVKRFRSETGFYNEQDFWGFIQEKIKIILKAIRRSPFSMDVIKAKLDFMETYKFFEDLIDDGKNFTTKIASKK